MNGHLSQDILIQYIFDLGEEGTAGYSNESIVAHLGKCSDCTARLEQLKAKFSTLDVLSEEIKAGDSLIAKTIANAKAPRKSPRNRFIPPTWVSAVAAVLLIGTLAIAIFQIKVPGTFISGDAKETLSPIAKSFSRSKVADAPIAQGTAESVSEVKSLVGAFDDSKVDGDLLMEAESKFEAFDFSDSPFAPASAIELNILPKRESTQITVYNSADLTLVREKRKLTLKRGWNWLQFMWANTLIDPTSLSLEPTEQKGKVRIEQLVFPARLKDIGRWLIASEVEGEVEFEISYFTSGVSWRAFYMGTLTPDEKQMKLEGYVRIANNSGEDYENAETRLIVGQVNQLDQIAELSKRQWPYGRPGMVKHEDGGMMGGMGGGVNRRRDKGLYDENSKYDIVFTGGTSFTVDFGAVYMEKKEIKKEGLSEYFLYTIEGTEDIKDKWSKRLPSLDVEDIDVVNLYKYEEEIYGNRVMRFLSFKNDDEHALGETPIPGGAIKVYRSLADGHLSYESESSFKYIPVNEKVELNLGAVQNVVVKPTLMDYRTSNYKYNKKREISGYDDIRTWEVEVKNTRDIDVEIEIKRNFNSTDWDIKTKQKYTKQDADTIKIKLKLKPGENRKFQYVLTKHFVDYR